MKTENYFVITGNIGSGKSTVGQFLKELGATVVDADQLARSVVKKNSHGLKMLVDCFGKQILKKDGTLNRAKLGRIVFANKKALKKINSIIHPLVQKCFLVKLQQQKADKILFYLVPLWFESAYAKAPTPRGVILVTTSKKKIIDRVIARSKLSRVPLTKKDIEQRLQAQLEHTQIQKNNFADFVINNDGTFSDLRKKTTALYKGLIVNF